MAEIKIEIGDSTFAVEAGVTQEESRDKRKLETEVDEMEY